MNEAAFDYLPGDYFFEINRRLRENGLMVASRRMHVSGDDNEGSAGRLRRDGPSARTPEDRRLKIEAGGWEKPGGKILLRKLSRSLIGVIAILLFAALNADAVGEVTCATDKIGYYQGEQVLITITNNSTEGIEIPDIEYIDGRFARPAREIKLKIGRAWKAMTVIGTTDDIKTKALKTKESHIYKLKLQTIDESMNEATSIPGLYVRPGTYVVFFHNEYKLFPFDIGSNEFTIKDSSMSTPK